MIENIQLQNSQQNLNLKSTNPTKGRNKNNCFRHLKTKCEKCTVECIQNENGLNHRHKQTKLEIYSYIFSDHKPGLLLYVNYAFNNNSHLYLRLCL